MSKLENPDFDLSIFSSNLLNEIDQADEIPLIPDLSSDFSHRTDTDSTKKFDTSSVVFFKRNKTEPVLADPVKKSLPLGMRSPVSTRQKDSDSSGVDISASSSYLRSKMMRTIRDEKHSGINIPTDRYIETEVHGGINTILHILDFYSSPLAPFSSFDIGDLISRFKDSLISAGTLKQMRLEITFGEAEAKLLTDSQISQLQKAGIINDDKLKIRSSPLAVRNKKGERLFIRNFNNLILANQPILDNNDLSAWNNFYFRIVNRMPILFRFDNSRKVRNIVRVSSKLVMEKSDAKRFALFLEPKKDRL